MSAIRQNWALLVAMGLALNAVMPGEAKSEVTAKNFGAVVTGRSFDFHTEIGDDLQRIGTERYFSDQSVVWMLTDGTCSEGVWFEQNGEICFNYGGDDICWRLDAKTPERGAVFSYRIGPERQVAFPATTAVPPSCDALLS